MTKCLVWSKDKQAVAIIDDESYRWKHKWYYRLIVWRAGQRVKLYDDLPPLHEEGIDALHWSPDNHRLLLQSAPGDGVYNSNLWCLSLASNKVQFIASGVGDARWASPRRVKYSESSVVQQERELPKKTPMAKWKLRHYEMTCN